MKLKTTRKAINEGFANVISVSYCRAQFLLALETPIAYTTQRVDGCECWGADVYEWGSTAIVTGYAPFGNYHPNYDTVAYYDNAAQMILKHEDYDTQKVALNELIARFIMAVTGEELF